MALKLRDLLALLDLKPRWARGRDARLQRCHTVEDVRALAERRLPRAVFDFLDGGADDELVVSRNRRAFEHLSFRPRALNGAGVPDLSAELLGTLSALPLAIAPCGQNQLLHPHGELAVVRAAARAGVPYVAASMASTTLEAIAAEADGELWFQLYLWRDRALSRDLVRRARDAGYSALVITIDTPVSGARTRDLANGLTIPPTLGWSGSFDAARHPRWLAGFARGDVPGFANVSRPGISSISTMRYIADQFDAHATWDDIHSLVTDWDGPVVLKGILSAEDARRAVDVGASALVVSNHGGRQLGRSPASLDVLPEVAAEVAGAAQVYLDSGVRTGSDIAAAVALGAQGCLIGRSALYGLAAAGEEGVVRVLDLIAGELGRTMTLLGAHRTTDLDPRFVRHIPFDRR